MEKLPAIAVTFSVKDEYIPILEEFNLTMREQKLNRSSIIVNLLKEFNKKENSSVEKQFDIFVSEHNLNKDAILMLLMTQFSPVVTTNTDFNLSIEDYPSFKRKENE